MFDFNFEVMSKVLKVSSEKMRDKIFQSLNEYITTITRQIGQTPDRDAVIKIYLEEVRASLGRPIVCGELTDRERARAEELDQQFVTDEWLYQKGGLQQAGVKIHQDVSVREAALKTPGGLIRVTARVRSGRIDDAAISGDFTMLPSFALDRIEEVLRGTALEANTVQSRIEETYRNINIQSPGLTTGDLTSAIMLLAE
jgi:lipoate-protein ligase A